MTIPRAMRDIEPGEATLNVTLGGQNGDLIGFVPYDAPADEVKRIAAQAILDGDMAGIEAPAGATMESLLADFADFEIKRFPAAEGRPVSRCFIRPKTGVGLA